LNSNADIVTNIPFAKNKKNKIDIENVDNPIKDIDFSRLRSKNRKVIIGNKKMFAICNKLNSLTKNLPLKIEYINAWRFNPQRKNTSGFTKSTYFVLPKNISANSVLNILMEAKKTKLNIKKNNNPTFEKLACSRPFLDAEIYLGKPTYKPKSKIGCKKAVTLLTRENSPTPSGPNLLEIKL
jgi:hypothetical protein